MQITMMATPNINKELHYLNKEDRLLRWLLVKHRDIKFGLEFMDEDDEDGDFDFSEFPRDSIFDNDNSDDYEDSSHDDDDDDFNQ